MCRFDRWSVITAGILGAAGSAFMFIGREQGEAFLLTAMFIAIWTGNRRNQLQARQLRAELNSHDQHMDEVADAARRRDAEFDGLMRDNLSLEIDQTGLLQRIAVGHGMEQGSGPHRLP